MWIGLRGEGSLYHQLPAYQKEIYNISTRRRGIQEQADMFLIKLKHTGTPQRIIVITEEILGIVTLNDEVSFGENEI